MASRPAMTFGIYIGVILGGGRYEGYAYSHFLKWAVLYSHF